MITRYRLPGYYKIPTQQIRLLQNASSPVLHTYLTYVTTLIIIHYIEKFGGVILMRKRYDTTMSESITCSLLAVSIIYLLAPGEVEGINIPQEWKELLRLVCQENENGSCSQPIVRDVLTFRSAATLLCQSANVSLTQSYRC